MLSPGLSIEKIPYERWWWSCVSSWVLDESEHTRKCREWRWSCRISLYFKCRSVSYKYESVSFQCRASFSNQTRSNDPSIQLHNNNKTDLLHHHFIPKSKRIWRTEQSIMYSWRRISLYVLQREANPPKFLLFHKQTTNTGAPTTKGDDKRELERKGVYAQRFLMCDLVLDIE